MISVKKLAKHFGARRAVDGVSFEVNDGTVLGFLGPNGAGKTTTMRVLSGFLPPTSGTAVVNGFDVVERPVEARKNIGYLPENAPLYGDMTVEAFLRFIAEMRDFSGRERNTRADAVIEKCFLSGVRHQTIETLSKGYRQRTCFAQALLHDPPVLLLDEPTDGLDPNQKQVVRNMIRHMGREKIIILSTHLLEEVEAICSRVIIISAGRLVVDSTPADLRKRSKEYNALTVNLVAPPAEAKAAFEGLNGVARVEHLETVGNRLTLRLFPRDGQSIAVPVFEYARTRKWLVTDLQTSGGRLDDVFQSLTRTADVTEAARKED
jgi:ABC-2 type transport system ATP-binding protein